MKRLLTVLIAMLFATTMFAQAPRFAEFFMGSRNASDSLYDPYTNKPTGVVIHYLDSIQKMANERNLIYLMYYQYTSEGYSYFPPDPKDKAFVFERYNHLGGKVSMPNGFIMGHDILDKFADNMYVLDPQRWDKWMNEIYSVTPYVQTFEIKDYPSISFLTATITLEGTTDANSHVLVVLSENFPATGDQHVFRQVLYNDFYQNKPIECATIFRDDYIKENCEITVIVENDANAVRKVIGAVQTTMGEVAMRGLNGINTIELQTKIFPNPVKDQLYLNFTTIPKSVQIIDIQGKVLFLDKNVNTLNYNIKANFPTGVYFVNVDNKFYKFIKE